MLAKADPAHDRDVAAGVEAAPDRDDEALGRVEPTTELLFPADWADPRTDKFSMAFSRAAFDGWARQPSPCCAAASVAGACNAVLGLCASSEDALSYVHIAALLHGLLADQAAKKRAAVERLLGGVRVEPAIEALRAQLAAEQRSLGGRKEAGCKPKEALSKLRKLVAAWQAAATLASPPGADVALHPPLDGTADGVWPALAEALLGGSDTAEGDPIVDAGDVADEADDDSGDGDEALLAEPFGKAPGITPDRGRRELARHLRALLAKVSGMEQLSSENARISTGMIGNWGITGAVGALRDGRYAEWPPDRRLLALRRGAEADESAPAARDNSGDGAEIAPSALPAPLMRVLRGAPHLTARTLASVRVRGHAPPPIVVSKRDSDADVEAAWLALRAAFSRERSCLILHHRNHYSLIFAMREWNRPPAPVAGVASDGPETNPASSPSATVERKRQVLTARKGQRPTAWIEWAEVHRTLSAWAGYAIIEVALLPPIALV
ncbi:hypothetical protein KFE25_009953 [Diacronema lutheri]|uniref:Uncharacterized protein n=3 Tax=Diacronema lutheri TaxID=2081491 RepID=A0A8J6CCA9_DIALT|nr:hypothetical protein KFE25_009953 [Diacronema lutheri]